MVLKLYNTLFREKQVFKPINDNTVGMYCCGPTVYNYAHIGNLRTYIFEDFLRRILEYNGYDVNHVMNITDVGHLTDDGDDGEDKMQKGAQREGKSVLEIAEFYTDVFLNDLADLNITAPTTICKATEHIQDMISMISKIEKNGYAYEADGNVYYDISKFIYYADLGKLNLKNMQSTNRVQDDETSGKKNRNDFALWFTNSKFKNQLLQWDSPWGKGYPGWHIECSAMATKYLGEKIDIHCGGVDHIQVHHTNEIAQSEAALGKHPWTNFWMHGEFLLMNNGKMSKSAGTFVTLNSIKELDYDPIIYRFLCLNTHYRKQLNFTYDVMDNAKKELDSLKKKIVTLKSEVDEKKNQANAENPALPEDISKEQSDQFQFFKKEFLESINDDLNVSKALGILNDVLKSHLSAGEKLTLAFDFDLIFGLDMVSWKKEDKSLTNEEQEKIKPLLEERAKARENKDWSRADEIRDQLQNLGLVVKDTPKGAVVERV